MLVVLQVSTDFSITSTPHAAKLQQAYMHMQ